MGNLGKLLVDNLLRNEIAVFGGATKPPSKGHFLLIKEALQLLPNINEFIIFVGEKERDNITQDQAIKIWEIYKKYLSPKLVIEESHISPISDIYKFSKSNPGINIKWVIGSRENNSDDLKDFERRTQSSSKYSNLTPINIIQNNPYSGTQTRNSISLGKEEFLKNIPEEIPNEDKDLIWEIISENNIQEDKIPGGLSQDKTLEDIAKHHKVSLDKIESQIKKGIKVELEHTSDKDIAREIAMDHLWEDPIYYDKLEKMEKGDIKENKSSNNPTFKKYIQYLDKLVNYVCEDLQIERPKIKIINNTNYTQENHSFGGYQPGQNQIYLVIKGRNCSDSCRSLSHEIFHQYQDKNNLLKPGDGKDGDDVENAANSYAGKIMREFNRKYPEILTLFNN